MRAVELSLMQRSAAHIASETDIMESLMLGQKAFDCVVNNETGKMAAIKRLSDNPYRVEFTSVPVSEVANHEKIVPKEWITPEGNDVTEEMMTYLKPLIMERSILNTKTVFLSNIDCINYKELLLSD